MSLHPEIFENAAKLIEQQGWFGKGTNINTTLSNTEKGPFCVATALSHSIGSVLGSYAEEQNLYIARLVKDAGCKHMSELFLLNDNQDNYETGKAWAINMLREIARELGKEQLREDLRKHYARGATGNTHNTSDID